VVYSVGRRRLRPEVTTHVLMLDVLEQLEFTIGALGKDGRRKGLHDLLDRSAGAGELVFGGAGER